MEDIKLEKLGTYFEYHKIKERLLLTFSDFVRVVESGRWDEFLQHQNKPTEGYDYSFKSGDNAVSLIVVDTGYEVCVRDSHGTIRMAFWNEENSRDKAIKYLLERKKELFPYATIA